LKKLKSLKIRDSVSSREEVSSRDALLSGECGREEWMLHPRYAYSQLVITNGADCHVPHLKG
jgi:hypothetical protein